MRVPAGITIVNRSMFVTEPKGNAVTETHRLLHTDVVPEICVDGAAAALDFYVAAFGAEELFRPARLVDPYGHHWSLATPGPGRDSEATAAAKAQFDKMLDTP